MSEPPADYGDPEYWPLSTNPLADALRAWAVNQACICPKTGHCISAEEVKFLHLVADRLSLAEELCRGVERLYWGDWDEGDLNEAFEAWEKGREEKDID